MPSDLPSIGTKVFLLREVADVNVNIRVILPIDTPGVVVAHHQDPEYAVIRLDSSPEHLILEAVESFWSTWHDGSTFWSRLISEEE